MGPKVGERAVGNLHSVIDLGLIKMAERQYFQLKPDMSLAAKPWYVWVNEEEMRKGVSTDRNLPFGGLHMDPPPKFYFDKKVAPRKLRDAYIVHVGMWMVSERLRDLLKNIDSEAFVFSPVDIDYSNFDEPGPRFWLCDVVRFLDCVDERRSKIKYQEGIPMKNYLRLIDVTMDPEKIGEAHVFRLKYAVLKQIVDDVFVEYMVKEKIKGFSFLSIKQS